MLLLTSLLVLDGSLLLLLSKVKLVVLYGVTVKTTSAVEQQIQQKATHAAANVACAE